MSKKCDHRAEKAKDDRLKPALRAKRRKVGRPARITLSVVREIARKVAKGLTVEQSCLCAGVKLDAYERAMSRHPEFVGAHKKGMAAFVDAAMDRIMCGVPGWQGTAWILERRHHGQFARPAPDVVVGVRNEFTLTMEQMDMLGQVAERCFSGRATEQQKQLEERTR